VLTKLRLSQNFLTSAGIEAENQYDPADLDDPEHERQYLWEGDPE
jgi:hypothetical protein